ncbi:MAG: hypothetical protein IID61_15790 [SAR324 cluster bacterium]|nr:hypothetical protein [SAR324 cluster bacterium]
MSWFVTFLFLIYAGLGIATLLVWWAIYALVLTRGYSVHEALFGKNPNPAVAMDLLGGFLAASFLLYSVVSMAPMADFRLDVGSVAISLLVTLVLLAVVRFMIAGLLRIWFGNRRDAQGEVISFNNEIFRQRNMATSIFSSVLYLILVTGLAQLDIWNQGGYRLEQVWNMLGIWLLGGALVVLHSFLYLEYGFRNNILHECFHDNNPAAPLSLFGLVAGMLMLNHQLLIFFEPEVHLFNSIGLWAFMGGILLLVLLARIVLQLILLAGWGISLRHELVIHDNIAWGIVDGGLIFGLLLMPNALIT